MTVDNLNRANIEAQKTIKKQSEQLKVLQASLEDTQRQLQQTLDQAILARYLSFIFITLSFHKSLIYFFAFTFSKNYSVK